MKILWNIQLFRQELYSQGTWVPRAYLCNDLTFDISKYWIFGFILALMLGKSFWSNNFYSLHNFLGSNFWNRRNRRVAGLQIQYKGNIFWVTIFGIAGIAESQDCRFCINELKYIFLLLIFGIAGVAESQDSWFNINEIFFG